jgi:hypothetical protein
LTLVQAAAGHFSNIDLDRTVRGDAFVSGQLLDNPPAETLTSAATGPFQFTADVIATIDEGHGRGRAAQDSEVTITDSSLLVRATGEALVDTFIDPSVQHFSLATALAENRLELSFTVDQPMQFAAQITWSRSGTVSPLAVEEVGLISDGGAGSAVFLYDEPFAGTAAGTLLPDDYLLQITFQLDEQSVNESAAGSINFDVDLTVVEVPEPAATLWFCSASLLLFCLVRLKLRQGTRVWATSAGRIPKPEQIGTEANSQLE